MSLSSYCSPVLEYTATPANEDLAHGRQFEAHVAGRGDSAVGAGACAAVQPQIARLDQVVIVVVRLRKTVFLVSLERDYNMLVMCEWIGCGLGRKRNSKSGMRISHPSPERQRGKCRF